MKNSRLLVSQITAIKNTKFAMHTDAKVLFHSLYQSRSNSEAESLVRKGSFIEKIDHILHASSRLPPLLVCFVQSDLSPIKNRLIDSLCTFSDTEQRALSEALPGHAVALLVEKYCLEWEQSAV